MLGASLAKNGLTSSTISLYFYHRLFRIMPLMFVAVTIGGLYLLFIEPHLQYPLNPYAGLSVLLWGRWLAELTATLPNGVFWLIVTVMVSSFYLARPLTGAGYGKLWIVYWETLSIAPIVGIIYYLPERFSLLNRRIFKYLGNACAGAPKRYKKHFDVRT